MRIEIYKDWIIRSDERQIILCKSGGMSIDKKTGKEYEVFKDETYHRDIQSALEALCRKEIYACRATTLKELQNEYKKLSSMIEGLSAQLTCETDTDLRELKRRKTNENQ